MPCSMMFPSKGIGFGGWSIDLKPPVQTIAVCSDARAIEAAAVVTRIAPCSE
jgi:hypothetical protein